MDKPKRKSYAKIREVYELPSLVEIQTNSYETFLQMNEPRTKRVQEGLQAVFEDVFPIISYDEKYRLEFLGYLLSKPKYSMDECQKRGVTYASSLKIKLRLISKKETKEQEVYLGELPLMTSTGTFIINGDERVVVSQLHRSPGVSFEETIHPNGKRLYSARIIPYRGAWVEFEFDINDVLNVYIDRRRRLLATVLLRAFGFSTNEEILNLFPDEGRKEISDTLARDVLGSTEEAMLDIYKRVRPGDPPLLESAKALIDRLFFDMRRYDLSKVGRFMLNRKLGMNVPFENRVLDKETMVEVIRHLIRLKNGDGEIDDIDHLGNRRVRTIGELLQNQFRIGLGRLERSAKERMSIYDLEGMMPHNLINSKLISSVIKDFFGRSQLSQFMDQTNPLAELTHKRRLSALGPGGLSRERAGFEVRDVHHSHYGRICPIETPEGPNIGLISSMSTYARVNEFGFLETPYRRVANGKVTKKIDYLSADIEDRYIIAQANAKLNKDGDFIDGIISCRYKGNFPKLPPTKIDYMDVSPRQLVSIAASLIPFLEHDDANRALMGSNMQRQAVPLLETEAPLVGTGMEYRIAKDSGAVVITRMKGRVKSVQADEIVIGSIRYPLRKFRKSNANTCINQRPIVSVGDVVEAGDIIADGAATQNGELALGRNVLVAFMPWRGYNFEDAILISEKLVKEDYYTSIHIEEFEVEARDTRLGNEEITRDIPNVAEDSLRDLDEEGIIRIGAEVKPGDIVVGKVTPKTETELSPEEKLLRAIFGEKAGDVKDSSLIVPPGIDGVVVDVKVFSRKEARSKVKGDLAEEFEQIEKIKKIYSEQIHQIKEEKFERLAKLLTKKKLAASLLDEDTTEVIFPIHHTIRKSDIKKFARCDLNDIKLEDAPETEAETKKMTRFFNDQIEDLAYEQEREIERIKRGDELPSGVLKKVVVYIASKRKLSVGDKIAGRHGNKGVIAKILPEEDMPFLPDGTPIEIVLNPLGVPSRMNVGQILETHLGWAAKILGFNAATSVFDGATEQAIVDEMKKAGLPENGKITLYDGRTGHPFDQKVTVGYIYMLKLAHLVDDKIHARSIGPYSLVTQQPLGGKAQFGGQRFGEMEVWALEAYGAAYTLQELLTVKSDDVVGRTRIYEAIVKGENALHPGTPESFNVLVKELQSLGMDVRTEKEGSPPKGFSNKGKKGKKK